MKTNKNYGKRVIEKARGVLLMLQQQAGNSVISVPVLLSLLMAILITPMLYSCAKMGAPDGGWYDETPPLRNQPI